MKMIETAWVIMSKDRKLILKQNSQDKYLDPVSDINDAKVVVLYPSKAIAEHEIGAAWWYGLLLDFDKLEPVEVTVSICSREV